MKQYYGTKKLQATPMTLGEYNDYRGWKMPDGEDESAEGYLVEYLDGSRANFPNHKGYVSWSPKDVFEKAYQSTEAMSFGHALEALKAGHKVARSGWNGKGMFVYLVPANKYPAQTSVAKAHFGEGAMVPYREYMALKTAQGDVATWSPSDSDALASDWVLLNE